MEFNKQQQNIVTHHKVKGNKIMKMTGNKREILMWAGIREQEQDDMSLCHQRKMMEFKASLLDLLRVLPKTRR